MCSKARIFRASIINSISIRTDSLQPEGSESIDEGADDESELSEGDGDVEELGVDVREEADADRRIVSSMSRSSYRTQIDPFSPIRYDTSMGSIHIVNSDGNSVCRN